MIWTLVWMNDAKSNKNYKLFRSRASIGERFFWMRRGHHDIALKKRLMSWGNNLKLEFSIFEIEFFICHTKHDMHWNRAEQFIFYLKFETSNHDKILLFPLINWFWKYLKVFNCSPISSILNIITLTYIQANSFRFSQAFCYYSNFIS